MRKLSKKTFMLGGCLFSVLTCLYNIHCLCTLIGHAGIVIGILAYPILLILVPIFMILSSSNWISLYLIGITLLAFFIAYYGVDKFYALLMKIKHWLNKIPARIWLVACWGVSMLECIYNVWCLIKMVGAVGIILGVLLHPVAVVLMPIIMIFGYGSWTVFNLSVITAGMLIIATGVHIKDKELANKLNEYVDLLQSEVKKAKIGDAI